MKKISKQHGNIRFSGYAGVKDITLHASHIIDGFSIQNNFGERSTIDENGNITCKTVDINDISFKQFEKINHKTKYIRIFSTVFSFLGLTSSLIFALFSCIRLSEILMSVAFLFWAISTAPEVIVLYVGKVFKDEEILSLCRFHGAEHSVINAYYDLNRIPTLEEISKYSEYSYNCSSLLALKNPVIILGLSLARLLPGVYYLLGILFFEFIITILIKNNLLFVLEFLVTAQPTEKEYNVAISSLKSCLENVQEEKKSINHMNVAFLLCNIKKVLKDVENIDINFESENCNQCEKFDFCKKVLEHEIKN